MIAVDRLSKTFVVARKEPGLWPAIRSLVRRDTVARQAVRAVSFAVGEGEIVGLVGENGAGKTTLVKMLAGVVHPTSGDARVLGFRPWERDDRLRRQIALVMGQKAQLWWDLPAADSFLLLREIYRLPAERYRRNLEELASLLEVQAQLGVPLRRLSLGERMKMELIACLLHEPRVVFLDEPTIGLDLAAQRAVRSFLLAYRREHRPAMLVTSHYMEDIETLCSRLLVLREGELVYDGSLSQVVSRYATHKVVTAVLAEPSPTVSATSSATSSAPPSGASRQPGASTTALLERLTAEGSRLLDADAARIRLEVPRERVSETAAALLAALPVVDLAIEEEDIGTLIARMQATSPGERTTPPPLARPPGPPP
jgi:ABC-2 type transport system ATP-binding protein